MRTFFASVPPELEEAAMVDGMSTYSILAKIILPVIALMAPASRMAS